MATTNNSLNNTISEPNVNSWYVDTNNGTTPSVVATNFGHSPSLAFADITTCLTYATAGDNIYLMPGFFTEDPVVITKAVNIISLGAAQAFNAPAQFLSSVEVNVTDFPPSRTVGFTGCAFIATEDVALTLTNTPFVNLQDCIFAYQFIPGMGPGVVPNILINGGSTLTGDNITFTGNAGNCDDGTINAMLYLLASNVPVAINLTNVTYNTDRVTNGIQESFLYSANTSTETTVIINGLNQLDNTDQSDTTTSDMFVLTGGAAHPIKVSGWVLQEATPSGAPTTSILRLANSDGAGSGGSITISSPTIDWGILDNAQIALGNATGANDAIYVLNGIFKTGGAYTLATSGAGTIVSSYVDGAGINHAPRNPNAHEWFMDTVNGNDANNGLSIAAPIQTIDRLLVLSSGGDIVHVATGSSFSDVVNLTKFLIFITDGNVNISETWFLSIGAAFIGPSFTNGFNFNGTDIDAQISLTMGTLVFVYGSIAGDITNAYAGSGFVSAIAAASGNAGMYLDNVLFNPIFEATSTSVPQYTALYLGDGVSSASEIIVNNCYFSFDRNANIEYEVFTSLDTNVNTRVIINNPTIVDTMTSLNGTSLFAIASLGLNAAHPVTVNNPTFISQSNSGSTLAPIYLAKLFNTGVDARIVINSPVIAQYDGLLDTQIDLGNVTGSNGKIFVNDGYFNTAAARTMPSLSSSQITATYVDGVGNFYFGNSVVDMGDNQIKNLADGTDPADAINVTQLNTALIGKAIFSSLVTVDLTNISAQSIFTVPTGFNALVFQIKVVGLTSITGTPQMSIGTTGPYTDIMNAFPIPGGLTSSTNVTFPVNATSTVVGAGNVISANMPVVAVAGTVQVGMLIALVPV